MSTTRWLRTPEADEYRQRIKAHLLAEDWEALEDTLRELRLRTRHLHR